jgi:hypothetical protein
LKQVGDAVLPTLFLRGAGLLGNISILDVLTCTLDQSLCAIVQRIASGVILGSLKIELSLCLAGTAAVNDLDAGARFLG